MRTTASSVPQANRLESGLQARDRPGILEPSSRTGPAVPSGCHNGTSFPPAEATHLPSGLQATVPTSFVCPFSSIPAVPSAPQSLTVLSSLPVASVWLSGLQAMLWILPCCPWRTGPRAPSARQRRAPPASHLPSGLQATASAGPPGLHAGSPSAESVLMMVPLAPTRARCFPSGLQATAVRPGGCEPKTPSECPSTSQRWAAPSLIPR